MASKALQTIQKAISPPVAESGGRVPPVVAQEAGGSNRSLAKLFRMASSSAPVVNNLRISSSDDVVDHEAERVAIGATRGTLAASISPIIPIRSNSLNRKCDSCGDEEKHPQRSGDTATPRTDLSSANISSFQTTSLAEPTRHQMERAFGASFSDVTIRLNSSEASVSVHASTEGPNIHFAAGQYNPGTTAGKWLIAHELAHVVQQRSVGYSARLRGANARSLEVDANHAADAAVMGSRATVRMSSPPGARQHYEAWEHRALGDSGGGDQEMVKVGDCNKEVTYGQAVALAGDFFESPEALMKAPCDKIGAILEVMEKERQQAGVTSDNSFGTGAPNEEQSAQLNADYEYATSGDDSPSFQDLAKTNESHFTPDNIEQNYKPKHARAISLAMQAWLSKQNSKKSNPSFLTSDVDRQSSEIAPPDKPNLSDNGLEQAPPDEGEGAPAMTLETGDPDNLANQALLTDGFAVHFLTDAFASGHLIDAQEGRTFGEEYYNSHSGEINAALATCLLAEYPILILLPRGLAAGILAMGYIVQSEAKHLMLRLIHNHLNSQPVWVQNDLQVEWQTFGDGNLIQSQETIEQASLAAQASRLEIVQAIQTGSTAGTSLESPTSRIPKKAKLGNRDPFMEIQKFASDKTVLEGALKATEPTSMDPKKNKLWQLFKYNTGPTLDLYWRKFVRAFNRKKAPNSSRDSGDRDRPFGQHEH